MPIAVKNATGDTVTINTINDLLAVFGDAVASPAANTLLARMKSLGDFVDTSEALVTATNAALATLNAQTDTLETLIAATNNKLDTLAGLTDGLEALGAAATPPGTNVIGKVDHTTSGLGHGKKAIATAGTDLALATSTVAKWVTVQAYRSNTGYISVGAAGVDAAAAGDGVQLAAGESVTLPIDNLSDVFIDATVNGEGVRFTYGT